MEMFPLYLLMIACEFHLSRSWYRRIQTLVLTTDYKSQTATEKWRRNILCLSFLNVDGVGESYTNDFTSTIPKYHAIQEFSD